MEHADRHNYGKIERKINPNLFRYIQLNPYQPPPHPTPKYYRILTQT